MTWFSAIPCDLRRELLNYIPQPQHVVLSYIPDYSVPQHVFDMHAGELVQYACRIGSISLLTWAIDHNLLSPGIQGLHDMCAQHCSIDMMQVLYNKGYRSPIDTPCYIAARSNSIDIIKWHDEHSCRCSTDTILHIAVYQGHLNIVQYVMLRLIDTSVFITYRPGLYKTAAERGHYHIIKWLHDNSITGYEDTYTDTIQKSHLGCVKLISANIPIMVPLTCCCKVAVSSRSPKMFKWIHSRCTEYHDDMTTDVRAMGNASILKWYTNRR